jgi:hypothetical protein
MAEVPKVVIDSVDIKTTSTLVDGKVHSEEDGFST